MSVIFSARSILIAYLTQSAQIHMNSCNTQNTHKMPPDQAQAMKSFPPQTQPGSFIKTGNNYPFLKPPWLHVFVVRQA